MRRFFANRSAGQRARLIHIEPQEATIEDARDVMARSMSQEPEEPTDSIQALPSSLASIQAQSFLPPSSSIERSPSPIPETAVAPWEIDFRSRSKSRTPEDKDKERSRRLKRSDTMPERQKQYEPPPQPRSRTPILGRFLRKSPKPESRRHTWWGRQKTQDSDDDDEPEPVIEPVFTQENPLFISSAALTREAPPRPPPPRPPPPRQAVFQLKAIRKEPEIMVKSTDSGIGQTPEEEEGPKVPKRPPLPRPRSISPQKNRSKTPTVTFCEPGESRNWSATLASNGSMRRKTNYGSYRMLDNERYESDMDNLCDPEYYLNFGTNQRPAAPNSEQLPRKNYSRMTEPLNDYPPAASSLDVSQPSRDAYRQRNCRSVTTTSRLVSAAHSLSDLSNSTPHYLAPPSRTHYRRPQAYEIQDSAPQDDWLSMKLNKLKSKRDMDPDLVRRRTQEKMLLEELKNVSENGDGPQRSNVARDSVPEAMAAARDPLEAYRREEERLRNTSSPFDDMPRRNYRGVRGKPPTPPPRERSHSPPQTRTHTQTLENDNASTDLQRPSQLPQSGPRDFGLSPASQHKRPSFGAEPSLDTWSRGRETPSNFQDNRYAEWGSLSRAQTPSGQFFSGQERVAAAIARAETPLRHFLDGQARPNSTLNRAETPNFPLPRDETPLPYHPLLYNQNSMNRPDHSRNESLNYRPVRPGSSDSRPKAVNPGPEGQSPRPARAAPPPRCDSCRGLGKNATSLSSCTNIDRHRVLMEQVDSHRNLSTHPKPTSSSPHHEEHLASSESSGCSSDDDGSVLRSPILKKKDIATKTTIVIHQTKRVSPAKGSPPPAETVLNVALTRPSTSFPSDAAILSIRPHVRFSFQTEAELKQQLARQPIFEPTTINLDHSDADTEPPETDIEEDAEMHEKRAPLSVIPMRAEDVEKNRGSPKQISHIELLNGVHLKSRATENYYSKQREKEPELPDASIRSFPISPTRKFDIPLQLQTLNRQPRDIIKPENPGDIIHHHPVFVKDVSKFWYKPTISREQAINMLLDKAPGTFVVRDSNSFPGAFGLALKVATPPAGVQPGDGTELVRHFLIEPSPKGVKLKGCHNEPVFGSLAALVYQHSITPLALPAKLILPDFDPANSIENVSAAQLLLEQGAACNVSYIGSVDCESLTGPTCVKRSVDYLNEEHVSGHITPVSVHFKVSSQGVTLTDNTRTMFFRQHFPRATVIYAGADPENRRWDNSEVLGFSQGCVRLAKIFAIVVRKLNSLENECHVFAEFEQEQPAHAVVNFINKVLLAPSRNP